MRRLPLLVALVLAALQLTPPAVAAEPTVVVVSEGTAVFGVSGSDCWVQRNSSAAVAHVSGPGDPPHGSGSLQVTTFANERVQVHYNAPSLSLLTAFELTSSTPFAWYTVEVTVDGTFYELLTSVDVQPTTAPWVLTGDVTDRVFDWTVSEATVGSGTMAEFLDQVGDGAFTLIAQGAACGTEPFYLDAAVVGTGADVVTYDFEDDGVTHPTALTIAASRSAVTAGQGVTLTATLTERSAPAGGEPVELWARRYGQEVYSRAATAITDESGVARATVAPRVRTSYQWRYAGGGERGASRSAPATVSVRNAVSLTLADSTLRVGQTLVARGATTPRRPGVVVTLRRVTTSGSVRLGTATTRRDGTFRISRPVSRRGAVRLFVTVPAGGGLLAGGSPTRVAQVR